MRLTVALLLLLALPVLAAMCVAGCEVRFDRTVRVEPKRSAPHPWREGEPKKW